MQTIERALLRSCRCGCKVWHVVLYRNVMFCVGCGSKATRLKSDSNKNLPDEPVYSNTFEERMMA